MSLQLISAPEVEPISLADAKLQCRVDQSADDALLAIYIQAAREQGEAYTARAFVTQTWDLILDGFPCAGIKLARAPVRSIVSIIYLDANGDEQTMDEADYSLDNNLEPGWALPAYGATWPATLCAANAVRVRFTAGYGDEAGDVPAPIRLWMLMAITTAYQQRTTLIIGTIVDEVPRMVGIGLLDSFRVYGSL